MSQQKVDITAELHGQQQVSNGFRQMANDSEEMSKTMRQAASDVAILGAGLMGFANISKEFGILNEQQAKTVQIMGSVLAVTGTLIQATEVLNRANLAAASSFAAKTAATLTDTAASIAHAIAEKGRAVALAVVHALSGPTGWAIIAGATVAAASALALTNKIPELKEGGIVTQPTLALIGESGPEAVIPLNNTYNQGTIVFNIYGGTTEQVMAGLRRSGFK